MNRPEPRSPGRLPTGKRRTLNHARRQEWLVLALRISVIGVLYTALGSSEALAAIWLKSLWSLLPPLAFLVACRVERLDPTPRFPYGFYRAGSIAFLSAALALFSMGLYLAWAAAHALTTDKHPALELFWNSDGLAHWPGWPILVALAYSAAVPLIAGRSRQRLAVELHDKGLFADATMGQVSWRAGAAAALGIVGIGLGLWWADFIATLFIAIDILWHGGRHLRAAVCDLIDEVPRRIGSHELDPLGRQIREHLEGLDWIANVRVRLREEGRLLTGVALICPTSVDCGGDDLVARIDSARADIEASDWRLLDFELVPVSPKRWQADIGDG